MRIGFFILCLYIFNPTYTVLTSTTLKDMIQHYDRYTPENHEIWGLLFERQEKNLQDKACQDYLNSLELLRTVHHQDAIPEFRALNGKLWAGTGWTIEVVKGLIPVGEFFELLSRRRFCSSTWVRRRDQLDYLEEPDMFHDIFGHVPLLMNPTYADFMQKFGALGVRFQHNPQAVDMLERLYWFTIEFGLMRENGNLRIYGAGIMSSFGESKQIFEQDMTVHDFDIENIMLKPFRKDVMQSEYYAINSFEQLWQSLEEAEELLQKETIAIA